VWGQKGEASARRIINMVQEEEAFPRGGADLLSPLEKRQLNARAKADAAREAASDGGASRKRSKKVRLFSSLLARVRLRSMAGPAAAAARRSPPLAPPST
jgi:hypothetical protein